VKVVVCNLDNNTPPQHHMSFKLAPTRQEDERQKIRKSANPQIRKSVDPRFSRFPAFFCTAFQGIESRHGSDGLCFVDSADLVMRQLPRQRLGW